MEKRLSIVVLCFNKWNFTKTCLTDLSKLPNDHEIIVFDNGSTDETRAQLHSNKEINYIRSEINLGFAVGCNRGYAYSQASNVLFLNNDIKVRENHHNWTEEIIQLCPKGLVGPTMGQLDKKFNFVKESNEYLNGNSYMSGWCLGSSKEIWNRLIIHPYLGPFSEEFFCYFEDTDLSFRARELGIPFNVVNVPAVHFGKTSSKQLNVHTLYHNAREIFLKKWSK